jgi:N-acetylmuramoyl-L-alanine amidase
MRTIRHLVVHCTATPHSTTIESIQNYWRNNLGWRNPGYHVIIRPDGSAVELQPPHLSANGVGGRNAHAMHVAYIGGQFMDDRTPAQKSALLKQLQEWRRIWPDAEILGHRDFPNVAKACPQFNAKVEFAGV